MLKKIILFKLLNNGPERLLMICPAHSSDGKTNTKTAK